MSDTSTTVWVMDWYESASGNWGRSGRTRCEKCRGYGQSDFRYCPWCGRKAVGKRTQTILKEGGMWDD